jgi:undecaprenyl-diphosphatase
MSLLRAVLFGLLQAATEFLPVSSTAHLLVFGELLGHDLGDARFRAFATIIQTGTTAAVIAYFREDLARLARAAIVGLAHGHPLETPDARLAWYIVLGTIPAALAGKLLEKRIEALGNWVIVGSLVVLGLVLLGAELWARHARTLGDVGPGDAFLIGLGQAVALVPGSSRSGTTLTAGMLLGFTREAAARFSFLLSVPIILGAGAYKVWKDAPALRGSGWGPATLVGTAVSAVAGYLVIHWLLGWLRTRTTFVFVAWRLVAGAVVALLIWRGVLPASEAEEHGAPPAPPPSLTR